MSGNYDYPPASRRTSRGSRSGDRPSRPNANRLQHLRDLLNSERDRNPSSRALETLNREINEYRTSHVRDQPNFEQARADVERQLQQFRSRGDERPRAGHEGHALPDIPRLPALNVTVVNSGASTPESSRSGSGSARHHTARGGGQTAQGVGHSPSTSLLDDPIPHIGTPPVMPQEADDDCGNDRSRVKRRKLESDDHREGLQSCRYGHQGQVVPGALKMEVASCDGGTFEPGGESSWPENVLRNDSSVYCTKSDRCNLILRHCGEMPFCLKRIVIKAPKIGYDAPIQEGMVFVSMTSDELLARTARYNIHHTSLRRRNRRGAMQPSEEYLNAYRTPLQALERTPLLGSEARSESETDFNELGGPNTGDPTDPMSEFTVSTEYDEQSGNIESSGMEREDLPSITQIERLHMDQMEDDLLCSESEESESDDDATSTSTYSRRRRELQRRVRMMRRQYAMEREGHPRRRLIPSIIQLAGSRESDPDHQVLKPHARFFIERTKSMVTLNFDPPPSGRYILVKLWSPHSGGNIDIQSIIAHGFAGPRFFPAQQVR
ncbi:hypothetical protein BDV59DRAFT_184541 [Aspergillus ambiguus]|uniref:uncharacterized protein n=1 Tax=Aspergillus ambiguus TaxID=176160 RepID=UPI003CCD3978